MLLSHTGRFLLALLCFSWTMSVGHAQDTVPTHPVDGEYINEWLVLGPFFPDDPRWKAQSYCQN